MIPGARLRTQFLATTAVVLAVCAVLVQAFGVPVIPWLLAFEAIVAADAAVWAYQLRTGDLADPRLAAALTRARRAEADRDQALAARPPMADPGDPVCTCTFGELCPECAADAAGHEAYTACASCFGAPLIPVVLYAAHLREQHPHHDQETDHA